MSTFLNLLLRLKKKSQLFRNCELNFGGKRTKCSAFSLKTSRKRYFLLEKLLNSPLFTTNTVEFPTFYQPTSAKTPNGPPILVNEPKTVAKYAIGPPSYYAEIRRPGRDGYLCECHSPNLDLFVLITSLHDASLDFMVSQVANGRLAS